MNHKAIDAGADRLYKIDVPADWATPRTTRGELSRGPSGARQAGPGHPRAHRPDGRRQPACFRLRGSRRRPVRAGRSAYEKRGVAVSVPEWDADQVHPVQQVRLRLPARHHPSLRADRGRAGSCSPAAKIVDIKAGKGKGVYKFTMACLPAGLHGLRRLRRPSAPPRL